MTSPSATSSVTQIDIVDLQQQVARLQALLETSRQVHATVRAGSIANTVLRIVVRELELPGALITEPRMMYGTMPPEPWEGCPRFPLQNKDGRLLAELVVAAPPRARAFHLRAGFSGGACAAGGRGAGECSLPRTKPGVDAGAAGSGGGAADPAQPSAASRCRRFRGTRSPSARLRVTRWAAITWISSSCRAAAQIMAVADVAGKGLASAIVGTSFRSAFRAMAAAGVPLAELAARLNEQHYAEGEEARRRVCDGDLSYAWNRRRIRWKW